MDKIIIKEAKFMCNIGVSKEERAKKQSIFVDAELFFNLKKASYTDDIKNTIDYSEIYESIRNISEKREYRLIEALSEDIAKEILSNYPTKKIIIRVKKPLRNFEYAAVEITRKKNG